MVTQSWAYPVFIAALHSIGVYPASDDLGALTSDDRSELMFSMSDKLHGRKMMVQMVYDADYFYIALRVGVGAVVRGDVVQTTGAQPRALCWQALTQGKFQNRMGLIRDELWRRGYYRERLETDQ